MSGCVLAVCGAKGGVGKTTTAINLAAALEAAGVRTTLAEADLATANVADHLDPHEEVGATLHEVLAGEASVSAATYEAPGGFRLVPSGTSLDGYARADPYRLDDVLDVLREDAEIVVLDTPSGVGRETLIPLRTADTALVVAACRRAAARDAEKTLTALDRLDRPTIGTSVVDPAHDGPSPEAVADYLGVDLLVSVPTDDAVPAAQEAGIPVLEHDRRSQAAIAFRRLARRVRRSTRDLADTSDPSRFGPGSDRDRDPVPVDGRP